MCFIDEIHSIKFFVNRINFEAEEFSYCWFLLLSATDTVQRMRRQQHRSLCPVFCLVCQRLITLLEFWRGQKHYRDGIINEWVRKCHANRMSHIHVFTIFLRLFIAFKIIGRLQSLFFCSVSSQLLILNLPCVLRFHHFFSLALKTTR